jgi:hypothetical protein
VRAEIEKLQVHSEALDALVNFNVDAEFSLLISTDANDFETISMLYLRMLSRFTPTSAHIAFEKANTLTLRQNPRRGPNQSWRIS